MRYPITFVNNTCIHCGATNKLVYVDIRGNHTRKPIYPIVSIYCEECKQEYTIRWVRKSEDSEKMIPLCTSDELKSDLEQVITEYASQNKRDIGGVKK